MVGRPLHSHFQFLLDNALDGSGARSCISRLVLFPEQKSVKLRYLHSALIECPAVSNVNEAAPRASVAHSARSG